MTVRFRNVTGSPTDPVERWPYEGLTAAIERGTITDWLPIVRAIETDPWGVVARRVERYLSYARPYGVASLLERAIERSRREARERERATVAARVRSLIDASGLARDEFAQAIGTSRSRLSTYASGTVIPSATLLVRMEDVASRARVRRDA